MASFAYLCHSLGVPEYPYPQSEFSKPQLIIENKLNLHYHPQRYCCCFEEATATQTGHHHLKKLLIQSFKILVVAFPIRAWKFTLHSQIFFLPYFCWRHQTVEMKLIKKLIDAIIPKLNRLLDSYFYKMNQHN